MKVTLIALLCVTGLLNACGNCDTRDVVFESTSNLSFMLTVSDPNDTNFEKEANAAIRPGTFEMSSVYTHDTRPFPENKVTFQFFFRKDALPNHESIFDQAAGEVFEFVNVTYDPEGDDVVYEEFNPPNGESPTFLPLTYSGTVSIIEDNIVRFDLLFSDDDESRRVQADYEFEKSIVEQPNPSCDV